MTKWEHALIERVENWGIAGDEKSTTIETPDGRKTVSDTGDAHTVRNLLDELGREGWELVGVEAAGPGTTSERTNYWLRRPLTD
jgi:hypothetical protein